jgi:hypothetical protein
MIATVSIHLTSKSNLLAWGARLENAGSRSPSARLLRTAGRHNPPECPDFLIPFCEGDIRESCTSSSVLQSPASTFLSRTWNPGTTPGQNCVSIAYRVSSTPVLGGWHHE